MGKVRFLRATDPAEASLVRLGITTVFLIGVCAALVMALIAQVTASHSARKAEVASVQAQAASREALSVIACVNNILATRNPGSSSDEAAHVLWASAVARLIAEPQSQAIKDYPAFITETRAYAATLTSNQNYRNDHPLGRC